MTRDAHELAPESLRWTCDPSVFSFKTTAEIPPLKGIVEQERPTRAIRFGLDITSPGYNIYVSGLTGTGKTTVIKTFLEEIAAKMPSPGRLVLCIQFSRSQLPHDLEPACRTGKGFEIRDGRLCAPSQRRDSQGFRIKRI